MGAGEKTGSGLGATGGALEPGDTDALEPGDTDALEPGDTDALEPGDTDALEQELVEPFLQF